MTDPTPQLDRLIARLSSLIAASTGALQISNAPSVADDWYDELARQLRRYTLAAYVSGSGQSAPNRAQQRVVEGYVKTQLEFLAAFRDEIKASGEWQPGWAARADMYAESVKAAWWSGNTWGWPLPAMPGDGTTQCLTRCRCAWQIDELEGDRNADATWVVSEGERCQTCIERGAQWNPLQVRNGELL